VEFSAEEDSAHLRIEGADTAIEEIRKVTARFPVVRTTPTGEMDGGPENDGGAVPPTATQEIELQLPKQSVSLLRIDRSLPLDRHVLLEAKASAGGKVDLVVARVRRVE
ncbi:MAG TPA: hypothetical protein VK116_17430, partial [Planctomycetota bacterium]|nr:hypothetical protein [Planctomycetota bacterium]